MPENTELMARILANEIVDVCDTMTDLMYGLVDVCRKADQILHYPETMPQRAALQQFAKEESLSLQHLGEMLVLIGRKHGAKFHVRGLEVKDTLLALQESSCYDLGVNPEEVHPF